MHVSGRHGMTPLRDPPRHRVPRSMSHIASVHVYLGINELQDHSKSDVSTTQFDAKSLRHPSCGDMEGLFHVSDELLDVQVH